ncbi:MAG: hypothetical protein N5P05_002120 [Chroococcopsis gigantea SAG 12.99]|jgi:hypothetical protein|nr:hypothetical protein [Chlorogloea purpurea SAG 13.99]MDV3000514.1 hypothetical protein [Chroococcopsis gigantea SAG 12.99]
MSEINYTVMSDQELRQYFLEHRQDKSALRAYLDRVGDRPRHIITTVDDPDFEAKIGAAVSGQLKAGDERD